MPKETPSLVPKEQLDQLPPKKEYSGMVTVFKEPRQHGLLGHSTDRLAYLNNITEIGFRGEYAEDLAGVLPKCRVLGQEIGQHSFSFCKNSLMRARGTNKAVSFTRVIPADDRYLSTDSIPEEFIQGMVFGGL